MMGGREETRERRTCERQKETESEREGVEERGRQTYRDRERDRFGLLQATLNDFVLKNLNICCIQ